MTIFEGVAEFERALIRERTGAGREAPKKRGVQFGRPRKLVLDQSELAQRLVSEGKSVREIGSVFKCPSGNDLSTPIKVAKADMVRRPIVNLPPSINL